MRVEGVVAPLPSDPAGRFAAMVDRFVPGTVPLLSAHGGDLIGWLDHVEVDRNGLDLRFTGDVVDATADRLRDGLAVSIEAVDIAAPGERIVRPGGDRWLARRTYFCGDLAVGWNLVGIALSTHPAAPGSVVWTASALTAEPSGSPVQADPGHFSGASGSGPMASPENTEIVTPTPKTPATAREEADPCRP